MKYSQYAKKYASSLMIEINSSQRRYFLLCSIVILAFLVSRIFLIHLDIVENWKAFYYQPIDEFYYNISAIDFLFGNDNNELALSSLPSSILFGGGIHNVISTVFLYIFGLELYSIRLASVFTALSIVVILTLVLNRYVSSKFVRIFSLLYLCSEASFLSASIISEFSLSRMLVVITSFCIVCWAIRKNLVSNYFALGLSTSLLVFFSYITNVFILLAAFLLVTYIGKKSRFVIAYIVGVIIGTLFFVYFNYYFLSVDLIKEVRFLIDGFGSRVTVPSSESFIYRLYNNFLNFFDANFFRFNLFFLVYSTFSIFSLIILFKRLGNNEYLIVLVFILSFVLQCLFINDFPYRKLITILPIFILANTFFFDFILKSKDHLSNLKIILLFSFTGLSLFGWISAPFFVSINDKWLYFVLILICFVLFTFVKNNMLVFKINLLIMFIIPNIFCWYSIVNYDSKYSNSIKEMKDYIGNDILVGGFSYAYSASVSKPPLVNIYRYKNLKEEYLKDICTVVTHYQDSYDIYSIGVGAIHPTYNDYRFKSQIVRTWKINEPSSDRDIALYKISLLEPFCLNSKVTDGK
ncbi:hypothetical protein ACQEXU_12630 [Vibrio sp. TRT 21S02]|uniref:hypothetical protein n=1 Tax=Vibrio sp. TRT 21S02 TaxID=3418507 RepID=UPI003CF3655C